VRGRGGAPVTKPRVAARRGAAQVMLEGRRGRALLAGWAGDETREERRGDGTHGTAHQFGLRLRAQLAQAGLVASSAGGRAGWLLWCACGERSWTPLDNRWRTSSPNLVDG
jgi:hypothetical protein